MAGRIPQKFVDDVVARTDIVEIIDEYVPLKRGGKDLKACCPFHGEKTPSFTVSREKQFYHCFGCGAHGTVIGFLMDYARLDFPAAVEELAARLNLTVPREGGGSSGGPDTRPLYDALEQASDWFQRQLREHADAGRAVEYLRGRGLDGRTARDFRLGLAPAGWESCARAIGKHEPLRSALVEAGVLAARDDGSLYDRLRDRVVFPIRDARGRTIGFGGRVLDDETPKYLNSPETPVFHKSQALYGIFEARGGIREHGFVLVVEGYMDVVSLAQAGFDNAVASMGTAVTAEHLKRLFRACPHVVFCFDGDGAGRRAAWKALEQALPVLRDSDQAQFCFLPDGQDPDTFVREAGREAFEAYIADAPSLGVFMFDALCEDLDLTTIDDRSRLVERARPLLAKLEASAFASLARARLVELSRLPQRDVAAVLGDALSPSAGPPSASHPTNTGSDKRPSLVRTLLTLLLHDVALAQRVEAGALQGLDVPGGELLRSCLEVARGLGTPTTGGLLEAMREHEHHRHLVRLASKPAFDISNAAAEFDAGIARLAAQQQARARRIRLDALAARSPQSLTADEKNELLELTRSGAS